jgi:MFS family permease
LQGIAGALVVPNSLALVETTFSGEARGAAIGQWAGWSGISTALGPLAGGWLVDAVSWRLVFVCVVPFALAGVIAASGGGRVRPDARKRDVHIDYAGTALVTLGLGGLVGALIAGPDAGFGQPAVIAAGVGGIALLVAFIVVEQRTQHALLPLDVFRSRQFSGVNATTLLLYAALNALFFLLMLQLQNVLGYSALAAGASLLPINVLMLLLSPIAGRFAERHGPRAPMVAGALIAGVGALLFTRVQSRGNYLTTVLPAAAVFGLGLACFVAPLTSVALGALDEDRAGLASGVNNAVARLAGLLATATIPLAVGLGGARQLNATSLSTGFLRAAVVCAGLCAAGALVTGLTIDGSRGSDRSHAGTDRVLRDAP